MKKKMIALSLGFMFLIAGFSFNLVSFEVNSNEATANIKNKLSIRMDCATFNHDDDCTDEGQSCTC